MKCLDCNFENPEGMKFCGNCGEPLLIICPSCSYNNPAKFKFCGNCGSPLRKTSQIPDELAQIQKYIPSYLAEKIRQSKGRIEGERRNVTVTFSDISGFTSMSEARDLEEVSAIVNMCHALMGRIIYEYEGVVDKVVGDGLMSIFGIPTHEDDHERAILAAMEMQQSMKELSQEMRESIGVTLELSIGINTGVVIIGDIGTDLRLDYTVIGDVVNTTSRVQEQAKPGEILVTEKTYKRAAHCFDFEMLKPIHVKGKKQPLHLYKVLARKEARLSERGIEGLKSPLIGRDMEFAICKQVMDQLSEGKGGTLVITGEAGLGKSRLVEELKEYGMQRDNNTAWLEGRCFSHSRSINYWALAYALRRYFSIENKNVASEVEEKIRSRLSILSKLDTGRSSISGIAPVISSLLLPKLRTEKAVDDLDESERKLRVYNAVRDLLAMESQLRPVVLVLDDLHWADELSVELLLFLMRELSQHRVLFICMYRPPIAGEPDTFPILKLEKLHETGETSGVTGVSLSPLSSDASDAILNSLLAAGGLSQGMKEIILGKSAGNPLYLEEIIRAIIADRAIERRDGKWVAVKELEDIEVPSTVQDVIMARIDRLMEEPKAVLQYASVIGRSFERDLLSYLVTSTLPGTGLLSGDGETEMLDKLSRTILKRTRTTRRIYSHTLDEHLRLLEDMGFIAREENDGDVFNFRHVLIQDVAYSTILMRRRKELHEMICRYIEETYPQRLDEFYEILAHHYSNSDNTESALSYLVKAGNKNRQSSTGSAESALRYLQSAKEILETSSLGPEHYALHEQEIYNGEGETYWEMGRYDDAFSSFEAVLRASEKTKDYRMKAEALRMIANYKVQINDWEAALDTYEKSLVIVRELGDLPQIGFVYNSIGYGYLERGDPDEAMKYFKEALRIGKQSGDLRLMGDANNSLGTITSSFHHDFDKAIRYYQDSLQSYREVGEVHFEAQAYQNLGITYFKKNDLEIADRYYEESLKISEKGGYNRLIAYTYLNRAELYLWQCNLDKAMDFCNRAFEILSTLDDKWACAEGYKYYGMIYRRQKNFYSAKEAFSMSLKFSNECEYKLNMAEVYFEMGLVHKEEMPQEALEYFRISREIFHELNIPEEAQKVGSYIDEMNQHSTIHNSKML